MLTEKKDNDEDFKENSIKKKVKSLDISQDDELKHSDEESIHEDDEEVLVEEDDENLHLEEQECELSFSEEMDSSLGILLFLLFY